MTFDGESERHSQTTTTGRIINLDDEELELYALAVIKRIRRMRKQQKSSLRPEGI